MMLEERDENEALTWVFVTVCDSVRLCDSRQQCAERANELKVATSSW